jgi:hypothetical protein
VRGGFFQDALKNLDRMTIIAQQNAALSPICGVLGQLFAFQRQLIEMFVRAQQGIVQEQIVRAQISQLIQQVNIGQPLIAEEKRQYSQASAQPDMLLSEGLFKSAVKVGAENAW